jgi:exosome complex RNA-binding protein Rrp42 (RNase PH superfamily)
MTGPLPASVRLLKQIQNGRRLDCNGAVPDHTPSDLLRAYTYESCKWTSKNQTPLEYIQVCVSGTSTPVLHVSCRAEAGLTYEDTPLSGQLTVNFLTSQLADPVEEQWSTMQKPQTAEYSRVIDRGLRAAVISESRLYIRENICWKLSVDISAYSTDHPIVDLSYVAVLKLLKKFSLPVYKGEQSAECNRPGYIVLTQCLATTVHMTKRHSRLYTSLGRVEADSVDCSILVVSSVSGSIRALQKMGSTSASAEVILAAVAVGIAENTRRLLHVHD